MADITYTLNLLFHETGLYVFQKYFGFYWYENELLPSIREDYQRNPFAPVILKDYLSGKKNKTDLDVSILSRYLLINDKYKNLITKTDFDSLQRLRKDRNKLAHESLSLTEQQNRGIVKNIVNAYNNFGDIVFSENLVKNINDLAGVYGLVVVQMRKVNHSNPNNSSGNSNNKNQTAYSQNINNTEKHWWEKDVDKPNGTSNQQWNNAEGTTNNSNLNTGNSIDINNLRMNMNEMHKTTSSKTSSGCITLCVILLFGYLFLLVKYSNKAEIIFASTLIFVSLIALLKFTDSRLVRTRTINKAKDMSNYKGKTIKISCPKCNKKMDAPDTNGDIQLKCLSCKYEFMFSSVDIVKNKAVKKNMKRKEKEEENKSKSQREKVIYICPFCKSKVRVDKPRKQIIITCPICKNEFSENP